MRRILLGLALCAGLLAAPAATATPAATADAPAATAAPPGMQQLTPGTKHYTAKARFRDNATGQVVTGIQTDSGRVFVGFDTVTETVDPAPDTAVIDDEENGTDATGVWTTRLNIRDSATWTQNSTYSWTLNLKASVGWHSYDGVHYSGDLGPYQFRFLPGCVKNNLSTGRSVAAGCNFDWRDMGLQLRSGDFGWNAPWGTRDEYVMGESSHLFAGAWHGLSGTAYGYLDYIISKSSYDRVRIVEPNHLSSIYCSASMAGQIMNSPDTSWPQYADYCTGLTRIG
jgi:hypothetical protein